MSYKAINLRQEFGLFAEHWAPKVVAEMNDYQFKVVKLQGELQLRLQQFRTLLSRGMVKLEMDSLLAI